MTFSLVAIPLMDHVVLDVDPGELMNMKVSVRNLGRMTDTLGPASTIRSVVSRVIVTGQD